MKPFQLSFSNILIGLSALAVLGIVLWTASDSEKEWKSADDLLYLEDINNEWNAHQVMGLPDSAFTSAEGKMPNFGFYTGTAWLLLTVSNQTDYRDERIVEIRLPHLNIFEVSEISADGLNVISMSGDDKSFDSRLIKNRNYQLSFDMPPHQAKRLLLRCSTRGEQMPMPISVLTRSEVTERERMDTLIRGSYFGLVVFVLLFNLFIYLIIKEKSSLYYLLYNLTLLFLQLSLSGLAFQYLWPNSTYLANVSNPFFASISVFALIHFSRNFLDLTHYFPVYDRIFKAIGWVLLVNAGISLIYIQPFFYASIIVVNGIALLLNIFIIPVAFAVSRKNFKPAKFFLLGFIALVLTVFLFILSNFGIIQSNFFTDYGLLIGSASEVILLSFAIVDRFKSFRDEALDRLVEINKITAETNEQLEIKVKERTEEILERQIEIEQQKEEIISSIRYAERIQKNILPSEESIRELFPESFVFFRPKDIVSGDFYWVAKTTTTPKEGVAKELLLFATADCTGHGVPGAFMSLLGYNILERSVTERSVNNPGEALNYLNDQLMIAFQQSQNNEMVRDGMDILLGALDPMNRKLYYAGANLKLLVYRKGEIFELAGDRMGVGLEADLNSFGTYECSLEPGDIIYSFSDGFKDQFGGAFGKKLKISGFREALSTIGSLTFHDQKQRLADFFEKWKGHHEQVDDVCVFALKVS